VAFNEARIGARWWRFMLILFGDRLEILSVNEEHSAIKFDDIAVTTFASYSDHYLCSGLKIIIKFRTQWRFLQGNIATLLEFAY
jgi:hypothetical protein